VGQRQSLLVVPVTAKLIELGSQLLRFAALLFGPGVGELRAAYSGVAFLFGLLGPGMVLVAVAFGGIEGAALVSAAPPAVADVGLGTEGVHPQPGEAVNGPFMLLWVVQAEIHHVDHRWPRAWVGRGRPTQDRKALLGGLADEFLAGKLRISLPAGALSDQSPPVPERCKGEVSDRVHQPCLRHGPDLLWTPVAGNHHQGLEAADRDCRRRIERLPGLLVPPSLRRHTGLLLDSH